MSEAATVRRTPKLRGWMVFAIIAALALVAGGITGRVLTTVGYGSGPSDTVRRLFQAVRDNDANAALAELATPPSDTKFLTNEVLTAGHTSGAITDLEVTATSSMVVPVSYKLGGEAVTDRISVQPVGNGFKVSTVPNSGGIAIRSKIRAQLPLNIAGIAATTDTLVLFPGSYPLTTITDNLLYGTGTLQIKRLTDAPSATDLKLDLSKIGRSAAATAVTSSLASCSEQKSFTPTGCPFKLAVTTADSNTVSWALLSTPADDLRITVSATDATRSTVEVPLDVRISYVVGGASVSKDLTGIQAVGAIDLVTNPMSVTWTT